MDGASEIADGDRPAWALRIRAEREARSWSQRDAMRALRAHTPKPTSEGSMLRNWKRWEAGETEPDSFHKPLLAKTFGTVTASLFPGDRPQRREADLFAATGMDTLEIVTRLRASDLSGSTLEALRITADHLCSEYPHMPSDALRFEGQKWLRRITTMLDGKLTLSQHREMLSLAGIFALLVGCVEYDMGDKAAAEASRSAALSLGQESGDPDVSGWAQEMQAWYCLTQGDYQGVIAAAEAGQALAGSRGVSVQLAAQRAKAWARMGDRRQVEVALESGRTLLETLPYPTNLDNHFVVDPAKFDFYVMDCYRRLGEDQLAATYADQVLANGTDFDGHERSPMRNAEAYVTHGVVAARRGDVEAAVRHGQRALEGDRKSIPSLAFCSRELAHLLRTSFPDHPLTVSYLDQLHSLTAPAAQVRSVAENS